MILLLNLLTMMYNTLLKVLELEDQEYFIKTFQLQLLFLLLLKYSKLHSLLLPLILPMLKQEYKMEYQFILEKQM